MASTASGAGLSSCAGAGVVGGGSSRERSMPSSLRDMALISGSIARAAKASAPLTGREGPCVRDVCVRVFGGQGGCKLHLPGDFWLVRACHAWCLSRAMSSSKSKRGCARGELARSSMARGTRSWLWRCTLPRPRWCPLPRPRYWPRPRAWCAHQRICTYFSGVFKTACYGIQTLNRP